MKLYSGGIKALNKKEMYSIHQAVLELLEKVGFEVHLSRSSLEKLERAGLEVDFDRRRVRMAADQVLETIRQFAGAKTAVVTEDGVDKPALLLRMPRHLVPEVAGHSGFVFDTRSGMRPAKHQDMRDFIKLERSLGMECHIPNILPQDVPGEVGYLHMAAAAVKYCKHPSAPDCNGVRDKVWIERVFRAAGVWGPNDYQETMLDCDSPFTITGRNSEILEFQVSRGQLTAGISNPIMCASAPCTVTGALTVTVAEYLGINTITRSLMDPPNNQFSPFRGIGSDPIFMDIRKGYNGAGGPEILLQKLALRQINGEFYKMNWNYGIRVYSDAQEPGIQAAMEKTIHALFDFCQGIYTYEENPSTEITKLGRIDGVMFSPEQLVIDLEMVGYLQRLLDGIRVEEETIAKDLIAKVSRARPPGLFLGNMHTIHHARTGEVWFPRLMHRGPWDEWIASGRLSPLDLAHEKVKEALQEDLPHMLDTDQEREVDKVVQEAEKDLLGKTTGILP